MEPFDINLLSDSFLIHIFGSESSSTGSQPPEPPEPPVTSSQNNGGPFNISLLSNNFIIRLANDGIVNPEPTSSVSSSLRTLLVYEIVENEEINNGMILEDNGTLILHEFIEFDDGSYEMVLQENGTLTVSNLVEGNDSMELTE